MPLAHEDIVETDIPLSHLQIGMHVIRLIDRGKTPTS